MEAEGAVALKGTPAVDGTGVTLFGMRSQAMQYGGSMGSGRNQTGSAAIDALRNTDFLKIRHGFYEDMEKHMR